MSVHLRPLSSRTAAAAQPSPTPAPKHKNPLPSSSSMQSLAPPTSSRKGSDRSCFGKFIDCIVKFFRWLFCCGKKAADGEGIKAEKDKKSILPKTPSVSWAVPLVSTPRLDMARAQRTLEEGVTVPPEALSRIPELLPAIFSGQAHDEVERFSAGRGINSIFSLRSAPNCVFKARSSHRARPVIGGRELSSNEVMEMRFTNMVKAFAVCQAYDLDCVMIPHARKFELNLPTGEKVTLIAEERINIPYLPTQKRAYAKLSEELIRQSVTFIAKTGLEDCSAENVAVVEMGNGKTGLAFLDLEQMNDGSTEGIFGGINRGFAQLLTSEEHIDIALNEAQRQGITPEYSTLEERRTALVNALPMAPPAFA